jgi:mono/diheme cytochrome c family protein
MMQDGYAGIFGGPARVLEILDRKDHAGQAFPVLLEKAADATFPSLDGGDEFDPGIPGDGTAYPEGFRVGLVHGFELGPEQSAVELLTLLEIPDRHGDSIDSALRHWLPPLADRAGWARGREAIEIGFGRNCAPSARVSPVVRIGWGIACLWLVWGCTAGAPETLPVGDATRGEQIAAVAGGCGCHTPDGGPVGAGGVEIETPFGVFYSTNITSDPTHGIGSWSDIELEGALRRGVLPDGSTETPVMPYHLYAGMADRDIADLIAWMRGLPASSKADLPHRVDLPFPRLAFRGWKMLFAPAVDAPAVAPSTGVERGRYLVDHVAICGDCHTPRNALGAPDPSLYLGGVIDGPIGDVPNITPDDVYGVGSWDEADMVALLADGMLPDMDSVQGKMAEVVDGIADGPGYFHAPESDLEAMAAYLRTVPHLGAPDS